MDIDFEKISDSVEKLPKKKPIIILGALFGAVVIWFLFFRQSNTTTEAAYVPEQSGGVGGVVGSGGSTTADIYSLLAQSNSAMTDKVENMIDANNEEIFDTVGEALQNTNQTLMDYQAQNTKSFNNLADAMAAFKEANTTTYQRMEPTYAAPILSPTVTPQVSSLTQQQINAKTQISQLQNSWKISNQNFLSDGVISAQEQSFLNDIHNQAERVGIDAGFGSGGTDGSLRNIPN